MASDPTVTMPDGTKTDERPLVPIDPSTIQDPRSRPATFSVSEAHRNQAGVDFITRLAASFAVSEGGRRQIIESRLPPDHTVVDTEEGMGVMGPEGYVRLVDPSQLEFSDYADWAGELPEMFGGTFGAHLGIRSGAGTGIFAPIATPVLGVTAAGAGSSLGRQARLMLAQMLGSKETESGAGSAFLEGGLGEMIPQALGVGGKVIEKTVLTPVAKTLKKMGAGKQAGKDVVEATKLMAEELGIPVESLTPGMKTELPLVHFASARAEGHPVTARMWTTEIDRPWIEALHEAFGRIRNGFSVGLRNDKRHMGLDWPIKSSIDAERFAGNLVRQAEGTRSLTKELADQAWEQFVGYAPQGMNTPVTPTRMISYLNKLASRGAKFKATQKGVLKNVSDLLEDAKRVETLQDLDDLRSIIGEQIYEKGMYDRHGPAVYSEIMNDMDDVIAEWGPSLGSESYQLYRSLWRQQHKINNSRVVKKIFGSKMEIDTELLDDAAVKVFRSGSKEGIRRFKKMIGADILVPEQATSIHHVRGSYIFDQMKQLFMDRLMLESFTEATAGRGLGFSGSILQRKLFREIGEDGLNNIFGEQSTRQLKLFTKLMENENVARSIYGNFSNTALHNEMSQALGILRPYEWVKAMARLKGEKMVAKSLVKQQAEAKVLGQEFWTEGRVPDVSEKLRQLGRKTPFEGYQKWHPFLEGLGFKGPQIRTMVRAASQAAVRSGGPPSDDSARSLLTPGSGRPQQ